MIGKRHPGGHDRPYPRRRLDAFSADQETRRDAFSWRARVELGPLTLFGVHDRFCGGDGLMDVRLFVRLPVVSARDMNVAQLMTAYVNRRHKPA